MNIQKMIQAVTAEKIKKTQAKTKAHFEFGPGTTGQMNMIAFD